MDIYFATVGDVHGHMKRMVDQLTQLEKACGIKLSFVFQVGDFEPHRHAQDMESMACPQKWRHLGDFHEFHEGKRQFPWPIYFIGGNHEPYGWLDQNPQGFQLTQNCFYVGRVAHFRVDGVQVSALSGIYGDNHYQSPRPSVDELDQTSNRRYTYFNETDVERLIEPGFADILLLHDWPSGIIDTEEALALGLNARGGHLSVGNNIARMAVDLLRPRLVLCGHMHVPFRTQLQITEAHHAEIVCLSDVSSGKDGFAIFRWNGTNISEIT